LALFCIIASAGTRGFLAVGQVGENLCFTGHDQTRRIHYSLFNCDFSLIVVHKSYNNSDSA